MKVKKPKFCSFIRPFPIALLKKWAIGRAIRYIFCLVPQQKDTATIPNGFQNFSSDSDDSE